MVKVLSSNDTRTKRKLDAGGASAAALTFYLGDVSKSKGGEQRMRATTMLIFLKLFEPDRTKMSLAGTTYLEPRHSCSHLFEAVRTATSHLGSSSTAHSSTSFILFFEAGPSSLQPISGEDTLRSVWISGIWKTLTFFCYRPVLSRVLLW